MWEALAVFIALLALLLSVYQGYQDREFKRLSVKPKLDTMRIPDKFEFSIINNGLGPAIIKEIVWVSDKKEYRNPTIDEFGDYADSLHLKQSWIKYRTLSHGTWIKSGETYNIFEHNGSSVELNNRSQWGIGEIKGKIKYEDIYGSELFEEIEKTNSKQKTSGLEA